MLNKYKHKYISINDIYNIIKDKLYKKINYSLFYNIVKRFFEILIRDLVLRKELIHLPAGFGYVYIDKKPHKRAFHIRVDREATLEAGKVIKYKVPILDDFYYKLVWMRPYKFRNCKIMPMGYFKKEINNEFKN